MAWVQAGSGRYDVDLIIFDKDGTLFDFRAMWARLFELQMQRLGSLGGDDPSLVRDLQAFMGYDPAQGEIDPLGPLALATYDEIRTIYAAVLYRHGWGYDEALKLVVEITDMAGWPPLDELARPIGDVKGLLKSLSGAGVTIGVVTTDNREMTRTMLELIDVDRYVAAMSCADDGLPLKPAPDGIREICRTVGVSCERAMMVGDSPTDMAAARAAGVGARVGVLSGVSPRNALVPLADVVLDSIQDLRVGGMTGDE